MKTKSAIIYISLLFLILMIAFFFAFKKATQSNNKELLLNRYIELKKGTNALLEANNRNFENYILNASYETDLIKAVCKGDSNWLLSNFVPSLSNNDIDCVWILNEKGDILFARDENDTTNFLPLKKESLISELGENPYKNFYINFKTVLTQVAIAPVDLGMFSIEGKQDSFIYLVFGKKYDKLALKNLSDISIGSSFTIKEKTVLLNDSINTPENIISYQYNLTDFFGNKLATLESSKTLSEITTYNNYFSKYSLIYLSLLLLLGVAYYKFLGVKVLKPISVLSEALNTKDATYLGSLKNKNDEFGNIAKLLDNSFSNIEKLNTEIGLRIKTEEQLKMAAVKLETATIEKIRAEQDKIAKGDFLSTMSHEIRTPINGVIGIANLLRTEDLNPAQHELVDTLVFSSNYLLSILTDILDFSKIESGNLTFDSVQFNLKEICKNVVALNQANAQSKNLQLILNADELSEEYFQGDSLRLCQILNNLIGNAIKFTNKGNVTLSYKIGKEIGKRKIIEFSINDSGIGIAANKLDSIFDSFSQADRTISTNYGGTGLGLTITKKLIEMQGGNITVTSELNKGTTFTFSLEFEKVDVEDYCIQKYQRKNTILDLEGLKILVAEDNNINASILSKFLSKWNVKMDLAQNGNEVLIKLENEAYDLILMDLHMPLMGGEEALRKIRNNNSATYKMIPIIALTADATSETQKLMLEVGFNDYITKPFNPDKLFDILEQYAIKFA
jgi:two-component system, sensor histidine kinase